MNEKEKYKEKEKYPEEKKVELGKPSSSNYPVSLQNISGDSSLPDNKKFPIAGTDLFLEKFFPVLTRTLYLFCILCILSGIPLIIIGKQVIGGFFVGTGLASLLITFLVILLIGRPLSNAIEIELGIKNGMKIVINAIKEEKLKSDEKENSS